jgi:hypothetical protein
MPRKIGVLAWLNVVLVGALVLAIVFGLRLYPRLDAGQRVVNGLKPAFTPARAAGAQTGIGFVSDAINTLDPITTAQGSAAPEVPALIAYVSSKTGLSAATILATLQAQFPHTTALLQAIPLSSVTAELPGFLDFVASELHVTTPQLVALLQTSFPDLYQTVSLFPTVTNGWNAVPNLNGLTRFNGTAVTTTPQLRDYFAQDVVPVVSTNVTDYHRVATYWPPVKDIPPLLTAIGGIAILYGLLMMLRASTSKVKRKEGVVTWTIVLLLGVLVLALVGGAQIFPRLDGGSHLVSDAAPAYTATRIAGDQAGIAFISDVVNLANPIMNTQGGAAAEISTLLTTLSTKTGLTQAKLLTAIASKFPHTAALLQALPLSAVSSELPGVINLLHVVLNESTSQVMTTLQTEVPGLAQAITNLPLVVSGWDSNPAGQLTRFNGTPVATAPQLRDYFADDAIPAVANTATDFRKLNGISPPLDLFPGLLTVLGGLVVIYGIIMLLVVTIPDPEEAMAARKAQGAGGRRATGAEAT